MCGVFVCKHICIYLFKYADGKYILGVNTHVFFFFGVVNIYNLFYSRVGVVYMNVSS